LASNLTRSIWRINEETLAGVTFYRLCVVHVFYYITLLYVHFVFFFAFYDSFYKTLLSDCGVFLPVSYRDETVLLYVHVSALYEKMYNIK